MSGTIERASNIALRPTVIYLTAGAAWILVSDRVLYFLVQDVDRLSRLQSYKGWFYVGSTALVFFLVRLGLARRLQRAQAALQEAQKMEALGRMAASVAHDFRNLLTVIIGNAELASAELEDWHPAKSYVLQTQASATKGKQLVQRLMLFAQGKDAELKPTELGSVVQQARPLLQRVFSPRTRLDIHDDSHGAIVLADPSTVEQALLNLAANAAHALGPEHPSPSFSLRVSRQGSKLRLSASDNGCGMTPQVQARIFEPFFTTKAKGVGVGLGLPSVFTMMQACGGSVSVESQPGLGSTFHLDFPVLAD